MTKLHFILVISSTETIKHTGISSAGADPEALKYTAALDAEFIYHGHTATLDKLPVSPSGIVSPALISKACLNLLNAKITIIDAGAYIKPQCPVISVREKPGADIASANALSIKEAEDLISEAYKIKTDDDEEVILAECVVGGTTTAYGVLRALDYPCQGLISSSFPQGNHDVKERIISQALKHYQKTDHLLSAFAALGDPMIIFAAGLAAASKAQVTLAGGTQMIAVKALVDLLKTKNNVVISPSPWIINDKSANFFKLLEMVSPGTKVEYCKNPYSSALDKEVKKLSQKACAKEIGLEEIIAQYDAGHVKEGVGMGALLWKFSGC